MKHTCESWQRFKIITKSTKLNKQLDYSHEKKCSRDEKQHHEKQRKTLNSYCFLSKVSEKNQTPKCSLKKI